MFIKIKDRIQRALALRLILLLFMRNVLVERRAGPDTVAVRDGAQRSQCRRPSAAENDTAEWIPGRPARGNVFRSININPRFWLRFGLSSQHHPARRRQFLPGPCVRSFHHRRGVAFPPDGRSDKAAHFRAPGRNPNSTHELKGRLARVCGLKFFPAAGLFCLPYLACVKFVYSCNDKKHQICRLNAA
jgi:hypothetical protein